MMRWPGMVRVLAGAACFELLAGCAGHAVATGDAGRGRLAVTAEAGGTHTRTLAAGGWWYQTCGRMLLVIDPATGDVARSIELGPAGTTGPASDMARAGDTLFVALEGTGVVELSIAEAGRPHVEDRAGQVELGIEPATLSLVGDELYVSGPGGVLRWSDRSRWLTGLECGTVVDSPAGLVACSGRRVYRLDDGGFVGSASELHPLPEGIGPAGGFVFVRVGPGGASVGLMTDAIREVSTRSATVQVDGAVRRVLVHDDRLWVVTDDAIAAYPISGDRLLEPVRYPIRAARDIDFVAPRRAVVVGAFGRMVVRLGRDGAVDDERTDFAPGALVAARSDGRVVQAGGPLGWWAYDPASGRMRPLAAAPEACAPASTSAITIAGRAAVEPDGVSVRLPGGGVYAEPGSPAIHCLVAVDGDLWIGTDRGITVLDAGGELVRRFRLPGPVRYVFPLSGGGAVWVSGTGGFGTIRRGAAS